MNLHIEPAPLARRGDRSFGPAASRIGTSGRLFL